MDLQFEWDFQKAELNIHKHGIHFEDAKTVFSDPLACIFNDEWHSTQEQREIIIGHNAQGRLLVISFIERNQRIRLISARFATNKERKDYEQHQQS